MLTMKSLLLTSVLTLTALLAFKAPDITPPIDSAAKRNGYKLVWSDEFDGPGLPDAKKWSYEVGGNGWGNNELEYYTDRRPENARIENGSLIIEARKEDWQGKNYTSARLVTKGKAEWKYGRIEARAQLPAGRGTWPAIWMLGADISKVGWPRSGEIDIMEHVGFDEGVIHGTIHTEAYNHSKKTQKGQEVPIKNVTTDFHLYAIEWTADKIDFFVDNQKYYTVEKAVLGSDVAQWPFEQPFFLILNVAVGGGWGGQKGVDESIWPQRMEVDYVRVYQ